jgi:hypothetical protein
MKEWIEVEGVIDVADRVVVDNERIEGVVGRLLVRWGDALTSLARQFGISPLYDQANEKFAKALSHAKTALSATSHTIIGSIPSASASHSPFLPRLIDSSTVNETPLQCSPSSPSSSTCNTPVAAATHLATMPPLAGHHHSPSPALVSVVPPLAALQLYILALRRCGSSLSRCAAVRVRTDGEYCSSLFSLSSQRFEEAQASIFRYWPALSPEARKSRRNLSIGNSTTIMMNSPSPPQNYADRTTPEQSPSRAPDTSSISSSSGSLDDSGQCNHQGVELLVPLLIDWGQALRRHAKVKEEIGEVRSALRVYQEATQKYCQATRANPRSSIALHKYVFPVTSIFYPMLIDTSLWCVVLQMVESH